MTIVRHAAVTGLMILAMIAAAVSLTAAPSQASPQPLRGRIPSSPHRIKVTATVDVGNSPYGIAADPDTNAIYVTGANAVTEISGLTSTVVASIPVGSDPLAIATDPATDTVYVAINRSDGDLTTTVPPSCPSHVSPRSEALIICTHQSRPPGGADTCTIGTCKPET